jgi:hypothetical protein
VKVLQVAFSSAPWVRVMERTISWMAWGIMVLWVSGLLPIVLEEMEQITWKMGSSRSVGAHPDRRGADRGRGAHRHALDFRGHRGAAAASADRAATCRCARR